MTQLLLNQNRFLAGDRCDYCRIPARHDRLPFQIDHIIAQQHGGGTNIETPHGAACIATNTKAPISRASIL